MRSNKYLVVLLSSVFVFSFLFIKFHVENADNFQITRPIVLSECENFLNQLEILAPSVLIDLELLKNMESEQCRVVNRVKIGVDKMHYLKNNFWNDSLEVVYFDTDDNKDYLKFLTSPVQLIPKNFDHRMIGKLKVPTDAYKFSEFFRRAKYVECANRTVTRNFTEPTANPKDVVNALALLRDELLSFGMFPFIIDGTLLGWYRECSVIPHTYDMDVAVFSWDFNLNYATYVNTYSSDFSLSRKLGMLNDSYELTVVPRRVHGIKTDIFLLYNTTVNGTAELYTGGMEDDGSKVKFVYPSYDPWCAADLFGHLFWVSCTPEDKLKILYGDEWYVDFKTSNYNWKSSPANARENGKWTESQMEHIHDIYV